MTLLYSSDAAASPLSQFESVLAAVRSNVFRIDVTRSGYFMNAGPSDVFGVPDDEVQPDPKQGDSVNHSSTNSSSSSSGILAMRRTELMTWTERKRNKQTRYIHVIADEAGDRFRCGRTLSEAYIQLSSEPKFCTPQCKRCFKKEVEQIYPRLVRTI